ncbi:hypothetical protein AVEN_34991-1 [Araneus ventricosus]|uniref:Uncharacterized protein n=1 Tax=Araneus ventricosus TaxID=182803 RepID=A0A4Y2DCT1_ARAVE|nr:hypothetical protein AVEN_34991-1 [Araneus ventricosus]
MSLVGRKRFGMPSRRRFITVMNLLTGSSCRQITIKAYHFDAYTFISFPYLLNVLFTAFSSDEVSTVEVSILKCRRSAAKNDECYVEGNRPQNYLSVLMFL